MEKLILSGSLSMNCLITPEPFVSSYSCWQAPWSTIDDFIPSSSTNLPFLTTKAIKWESHSFWTLDCPSWTASLCYSRIYLFSLKSSPRAWGSRPEALSLKLSRYEPVVIRSGCPSRALRTMWKRAMVPQALRAHCLIKNTLFGISGARLSASCCLYYCWAGVSS